MGVKSKIKAYVSRHRSYQDYANKELKSGRTPVKFKDYKTESTYFGGVKRTSVETRLKQAGVNFDKDKPTVRLKRKK